MSANLLAQAATRIAQRSLSLTAGETVALVTDTGMDPAVHESLLHALANTNANVRDVVVSFESGNVAMELPDPESIAGVDAVLAAVTQSLTYNRDIARVRKAGARVISMPRITRATLERFAENDFEAMLAHTGRVARQFDAAQSTLELRSRAGTQLRVDIRGAETGITDGVAVPGEIDQIPAGVVSVVGKNANGVVVIDGPISLIERLDSPVRLRIENSVIVSIEGGKSAGQLTAVLDQYEDRQAVRHCPAEIGIGTNPSIYCDLNGPFVPECARALGMIHVGFGDDHLFPGGSVVAPVHGDFLLPDTDVWLDGNRLDLS